jgi:signal transduction histidine kinase
MRGPYILRLALATTGLSLVAGMLSLLYGGTDLGIQLGFNRDSLISVTRVAPFSWGNAQGIREGMLVVQLNGVDQVLIPQPIIQYDEADGTEEIVGWDRERPEYLNLPAQQTDVLLSQPIQWLVLADRSSLDAGAEFKEFGTLYVSGGGNWFAGNPERLFLVGLIILFGGGWALATGRAGEQLRHLAVPLAGASAAPFLLQPLVATMSGPAAGAHGVLLALAMVPLALSLIDLVEVPAVRRTAILGAAAAGGIALVATLARATNHPDAWSPELLQVLGAAGVALVPGLAAAGPAGGPGAASGSASGRLLQSTEFALAGATPLFAMGSTIDEFAGLPLPLWLLFIALAGRLTVRPLARLATRAQLQRDLVVAATEAERARVAADIHDDALQELTLLVRKLDAAGDTESAEHARTIAERLRAICGDLRLPILDDLGVGPALDWLVLRIERLAGGQVRLERTDGTRPPPDVELAFFRVAQEALANAVKHGRPPIVVRYRTTDHGASLSVDDAGPGIAPDAGLAAEQAGHFGLLNMAQRAEQIGAILDVRTWPGGGTHVALEWRPG